MPQSVRNEPVFELIKSMTKAEKRNFKLYARRLEGNQQAKFIDLFDQMDGEERYDEAKILLRCPIKKEQLPNMKAHLYRQILISMRLLDVQRSEIMQMHEQLDFATMLYNKGLYKQSERILEKVDQRTIERELYSPALEVIGLRNKIATLNITRGTIPASVTASRRMAEICAQIERISELSSIAVTAYSLYHQLGYARTQKDIDMLARYFKPRLEAYDRAQMSFNEKFHYYQAYAWFYYVQYDFVRSYRYSQLWVGLFEADPSRKREMYDDYMKGAAQILEGLYLMRRYRQFNERFEYFRDEFSELAALNTNAYILANRILYVNLIHKYFMEGEFLRGVALVGEIEEFLNKYSPHLDIRYKMLVYYKIACLYFGAGEYTRCMEYLARITGTKDPGVGRDLQCFSRMLNLIASYEAGIDYNFDYQIRSVYSFLVKMKDMHHVQKEILSFLKKLGSIYADDWKKELSVLHNRLKPYESHPYERRTFLYLDILSWLESKITGHSVSEIVKHKFQTLSR